ncbi:MAG: hypothetical protein PVJ52_03110 [Candidatus Woesebacteria bacterium]
MKKFLLLPVGLLILLIALALSLRLKSSMAQVRDPANTFHCAWNLSNDTCFVGIEDCDEAGGFTTNSEWCDDYLDSTSCTESPTYPCVCLNIPDCTPEQLSGTCSWVARDDGLTCNTTCSETGRSGTQRCIDPSREQEIIYLFNCCPSTASPTPLPTATPTIPPSCSVSLNAIDATIILGGSITYTASVTTGGSVDSTVVLFSSSNTAVAQVSPGSDDTDPYQTVAQSYIEGTTTISAEVFLSSGGGLPILACSDFTTLTVASPIIPTATATNTPFPTTTPLLPTNTPTTTPTLTPTTIPSPTPSAPIPTVPPTSIPSPTPTSDVSTQILPPGGSGCGTRWECWYNALGQSGGAFSFVSSGGEKATIADIISGLLLYLFPIVGLLLLLYLIYGGYALLTSAGEPKKVAQAKGVITTALIGFAIVFISYWIIQIVQIILGVNFGGFIE